LGYSFGDALNDLCDELIHHREGVLQGQVGYALQKAIVVQNYQRIRCLSQVLRPSSATSTLQRSMERAL
jgi:hypothetical protein